MPSKENNVLFLNLYAFSLTGGVEKVSKHFIYALSQLFQQQNWRSYSMHDRIVDLDTNYSPKANYKAFNGQKIKFILASVWASLKSNVLILSHANLLLVAKLVSFVKPNHRFILIAHGIEVWDHLSNWKANFIKNNAEVWAVSSYTKQRLIAQYGFNEKNIQVLNNSLSPFAVFPTDFSKPGYLLERYNINTSQPVLYTLSRLSSSEKYKGYDVVISALAKLKKLNQAFTYILAGKADAVEQARIEQLIAAHDLENEVKLIGYLPEEEITAHFLLADVFIMPSTGEGFGIVFIEAAACGSKVIGGNADGSTDALLNGKLGQMVNPTSEEEVMQAIKMAIANANHQPKTQQELTLQHFGFEQYVEKIRELIGGFEDLEI